MTAFENIKKYCKDHGMSVQELAEKAGVSAGTIYNWKYREPSLSNVKKVADAIGVNVSVLFSEDTTDNKKVDLNDNSNIYFYNGKQIPKEDMDYVKQLLDKFSNH